MEREYGQVVITDRHRYYSAFEHFSQFDTNQLKKKYQDMVYTECHPAELNAIRDIIRARTATQEGA